MEIFLPNHRNIPATKKLSNYCFLRRMRISRSRGSLMFFKEVVHKNFVHRKYLRWSLFLIKLQAFRTATSMTHLFPMLPFSTPWKHQNTLRISDVFWGSRKGALGTNGLKGDSNNRYFPVNIVKHLRPVFFIEHH